LGEVRQLTGTARGTVDWTIGGKAPGQDALPGDHAGHGGMAMAAPAIRPGELARVIAAARPFDVAPPVLISPPKQAGAPWSIASDAADRPLRRDLKIDGISGQIVDHIEFAQRHWIDRTIGYGIAVHEGALFGIANQILGTVTALFLVVLAVSGAIMWWRRRPTGLLGAPIPLARPRFGVGLLAAMIALALYLPLFGLSLISVAAIERFGLRRWPAARIWLGLSPRSPRALQLTN
jgi:uncharacterized iron-regulated membrane protein